MNRITDTELLRSLHAQIEAFLKRGLVIEVGARDDLQAVLDAAEPGTMLLLPSAEFVGNFVARKELDIRRSEALEPGRTGPSLAGPVLRSPNTAPAFKVAQGVRGVTVTGIGFGPGGGVGGTTIEVGEPYETSEANQPADVTFDRIVVLGNPAGGTKRGLALHGARITVTRSHVADIVMTGQETQAIWIMNGPGPYTITDNYLEASGENIMIGGDDPRIPGLVPSDILIEGNTVRKPLTWRSAPWDIRNLLEIKNGRRVTIRRNEFDGIWPKNQTGWAIMLTPRNQYGKAPWTVLEDILFEQNRIVNASSGINIIGDDNEKSALRTTGITIRQNLITVDRATFGGDGRALMIGRAPQRITVDHNTFLSDGSGVIYTYPGGPVTLSPDSTWTNNIFLANLYGFWGPAGQGIAALAAYYPNATFRANVIGGAANIYPAGNFRPSEAVFWQQVGADGQLLPGHPYGNAGTDGTDIGVDHVALP